MLQAPAVARWTRQLDAVHARRAPHVARPEPRARARAYLETVLAGAERRNGWQLAEAAGEATPYGMPRLVASARWDADAVRDDLRAYVGEHLGDPGGVLIVDETGFLKQGDHSAGVPRQDRGTAGRIANCQIGVFLAYASLWGHAFLDRELYLPTAWTDDRARCRAAGVPGTVPFRTKPVLAQQMLARALEAGVPAAWVTGDEVYGSNRRLRMWLEARRQPFVLAVKSTEALLRYDAEGLRQLHAATIAAALPAEAWPVLSAGAGRRARGSPAGPGRTSSGSGGPAGGTRCSCASASRRTRRANTSAPTTAPTTSCSPRSAPRSPRWCAWPGPAGRSRRAPNREAGGRPRRVRGAQVRGVVPLHHPRAVRARRPRRRPQPRGAANKGDPSRPAHANALLPLTVPDVRHVLARLALHRVAAPADVLRWSRWRRRHQWRAQVAHYRRREGQR